MFSKKQFKLINSLKKKKNRSEYQLFLAEGIKVVEELLQSNFKPHLILCTSDYSNKLSRDDLLIISDKELKSISEFSTPNQILGVFKIPNMDSLKTRGFSLVLDGVNDPGNLGTIIRLCDWFGIEQLVCSPNTVDCYNPKVVQASMGSLSRVSIIYKDLESFLREDTRPIYGALLNGENVYQKKLIKEAVLVLGNEANGISKEIQKLITSNVTIPQFGDVKRTESLNVATATAILLSEFMRN
jgi:TrmH family RNA methyltransferase